MDDAVLARRQRRSQLAAYRTGIARLGPGSRGVEVEDGLFASVVPSTPDVSVTNSVLYADPERVLERHDDLLALYDRAGCRAWTVWVRPGDDALVDALLDRGHRLDATPALMAGVLADMDLEPRAALDLEPEPGFAAFGPINEAAYGAPAGAFRRAFAQAPAGVELRPLVARLDGRPAACAAWLPTDEGDCAIQMVATLPEAQGRGLASGLLRAALRRARAAGCTTTTLEGSRAGASVYERLGYRTLATLRMLEHRAAPPA